VEQLVIFIALFIFLNKNTGIYPVFYFVILGMEFSGLKHLFFIFFYVYILRIFDEVILIFVVFLFKKFYFY